MNQMAQAFEQLKNAKAQALGKREYVLLRGRAKEALVSEITNDESFISGGTAQAGGFRVSMGQDIQPQQPEAFTPIQVRGSKLQVLSVVDVNGVTWDIVAGDPVAGEK